MSFLGRSNAPSGAINTERIEMAVSEYVHPHPRVSRCILLNHLRVLHQTGYGDRRLQQNSHVREAFIYSYVSLC